VNNLSKQARILIVDDDESIRTTLKAILEDEGYSVNTAASGKEAIQKTQETAYNLALLDIRLPDIEGVELLKLLKENIPRTRKIMLTGYPSIQNAVAAVNKKADAYLIKPVDIEKLLATVKDQLKQQEDDQTVNEQKMALFIEGRFSEATIDQK
jgi:two-component system, NtrC family, nitrogen regulation response regulator NtrX